MAGYRGHLTFGGAGAVAGVATLSAYTQIKDTQTLAIIFGLVLVGALLPDIDSDSGLPFFLSYGIFTLAASAVITYHALLLTQDPQQRILIPLIGFGILWLIGGGIVKRFTHHRGIFHSLPAMAVAMLGTLLEATNLHVSALHAALFGLAIGIGFLSHLLLDEIYALFGINSYSFLPLPNKAFGTALKLWSRSRKVTLICYILLLILSYLALPTIKLAFNAFPQAFM